MRRDLIGPAVVILARQFNPSIVSQLWLVRNGLLAEEEFLPGSLFADPVIQVVSPHFVLLVTPDQLQFAPSPGVADQGGLVVEKVGRFVRALPHTPYTGLGLNFAWQLTPDDGNVQHLTRHLFYRSDRPLCREFDAPGSFFGGYFSKDLMGFRLKLDVKPIHTNRPDGSTEHHLLCHFNFHADLTPGDEVAGVIADLLRRWHEARDESRRIANTITEGGAP